MRWLLIVVAVCLALTVLRAAIVLLLILIVLSLLWGALFRPAETFGFIALLLFCAVLQTHTVAVLALIGFLGTLVIIREPAPSQDPDENSQAPQTEMDIPA